MLVKNQITYLSVTQLHLFRFRMQSHIQAHTHINSNTMVNGKPTVIAAHRVQLFNHHTKVRQR